MKEVMKRERKDRGCKKRVYQRKNTSLEYCAEEGGTRGERMGLGKENHIVSQRGENLVQ
jgi:hypothetical protein